MARNAQRHKPLEFSRVCALTGCTNAFMADPWHKKYCSKDHQQAKYNTPNACDKQVVEHTPPVLDGRDHCYCGEVITSEQFAWASDNTVFCSETCAENYDNSLINNGEVCDER